ncbi:hypothetical protein D3C72_1593370 [compost metagenome]
MIRPGRAGGRHRHAGFEEGEVALRHRQIEPQSGQLVQVKQHVAAVDQGPFAEIDQADGAVERGRQGAQRQLIARRIDPGLGLGHGRLLPFQLGGGDGTARHQPAHVPQLAALVAHAGALLGKFSLLLARIQGDQGLPLLDPLTGAHRNPDDAPRDLGADHHGAIGRQLADQLDGGLCQALPDRFRPDVDLSGLGLADRFGLPEIPGAGPQQQEKRNKPQPYAHFHQTIHAR